MMKALISLVVLTFALWMNAAFVSAQQGFTENKGQVADSEGRISSDIRFTAVNGNAVYYFLSDRITCAVTDSLYGSIRYDLIFRDRSSNEISAGEILPGYSNYYLPHCSSGITGVRSFEMITYPHIYPGIDLHIGIKDRCPQLKFIANEDADISAIDISCEGADSRKTENTFEIILPNGLHTYNIKVRKRSAVLRNHYTNTLASVSSDDWTTYTGGADFDEAHGIARDDNGNVYVAGYTQSSNLPVGTGAVQPNNAGVYDAFVFKLDSLGQRVWATYYGGSNYDYAYKVKLFQSKVVICGYSNSANLPVTSGAWQPSNAGSYDAFALMLDDEGAIYRSTLFGGSAGELAFAMDIDTITGNIFIGGTTTSTNLPLTSGSFQSMKGGASDAFCVRFDSLLVPSWATYFGGLAAEDIHAMAAGMQGNVVFTGGTFSNDLPVSSSAYQQFTMGAPDGYVIMLDSTGNRMWATYFGGSNADDINGVAIDSAGNIYIAGATQSPNFPVTANAYQQSFGGGEDGFISSFSHSGALNWSTFFGGSQIDGFNAITLGSNTLYAAGSTTSPDLPVHSSAQQPSIAGGKDVFIMRMDTMGSWEWSSYFGGAQNEVASSIAMDEKGNAFISGSTYSSDLPSTDGVMQPVYAGSGDAFAARIHTSHDSTVSIAENTFADLLVYPNPSEGIINITAAPGIPKSYRIYDIAGRIVMEGPISAGTSQVNIGRLERGIYLLQLEGEKRTVRITCW